MMSKILKFIIPVLIIAAGFALTAYMLQTPQRAERQDIPERVTPVEVLEATKVSRTVFLDVNGTVKPAEQVALRPQVGGEIIDMNRNLIPGGYLKQNKMIIEIDPRDYKYAVEAAEERVAQAEFQLKLEKSQQTIAKQEWELLEDSVPSTEEGRSLALREPHIERAKKTLKAAQSSLKKAELDLARATLNAPFNAVVINENVDMGQVVSPQTQIATIAGTDRFWVEISVPMSELSWIEIPPSPTGKGSEVEVVQDTGEASVAHTGYVIRLLSTLDNGRLARLLVAVDDPLMIKSGAIAGKLPLLLGSYVNARIKGSTVEDVYVVPRRALRDVEDVVEGRSVDHAWVYLMDDDNRLAQKKVQILWRGKDNVYVSAGLQDGDRVITSTVANPVVGMKLSELEQGTGNGASNGNNQQADSSGADQADSQ